MAWIGLILAAVWIVVVAGVRGYVRARRTGDPGVTFADRPLSPQWWSKLLSVAVATLAFAAPIAGLVGLAPLALLDAPIMRWLGVALVGVGIVLSVTSQVAMGESWRGDVDASARTALVTDGPFRFVRNPTLLGTAVVVLGLAFVTPNIVALAMVVLGIVAIEIQVRLVEEPYLRSVHGEAYLRYAARTGRFLPGVGRLRT